MKTKQRAIRSFCKQSVKRLFNAFGLEIRRRSDEPAPKPEEVLSTLDSNSRSALLSMYRGEPQLGIDGQRHPIDGTQVSASRGKWLYDFCLSIKPKSTLEIGMAHGYSTILFLAAISQNRTGHHTAIDPFQSSYWHGIGLVHAKALAPATGLNSAFLLIEDRSDRAATDLARSNSSFDLIFIDGNHRFDDVLVDFYRYASLCAVGGHIVFDDMFMRSVQTAVAFVRANRTDFLEVRTPQPNFAVFRKIGDDSRDHKDFHEFVGKAV
jgi:predicted O-methyltransferase YrrM